ncbi:DNA polymerase iota-like [Phaenicophaeus curvirostris]|uniref:DNA polymerase iota-like n=1 Tax=Phaenicophaeus curvirostris TaxID=33595 RepID=UPI0037F09B91
MERLEGMEEEEEEEEEEESWEGEQEGGRSAEASRSRVIVHLDLDCFYAQVEMIRRPELRAKPLGVQQKSIVVTCNYVARNLGVRKLMAVEEAKEKCPHLVLLNGEDLTPYRETSYRVTELLQEMCPLVERLGFDENFVDVTELVEKRLEQHEGPEDLAVAGHVYGNRALDLHDGTHLRLLVGSHLASAFRSSLATTLGLSSCAGVASNKLLAKLVSGTFKPNQQTLLLPESHQDLLRNLGGLQKIPGIGSKTFKRLETLGIETVWHLQSFPTAVLEKELGLPLARRLQRLSFGEDDSPVAPSGPPRSLSEEEAFKSCSSEAQVKENLEKLLLNLLERLHQDGRRPHTLRLALRRGSSASRRFHRESRQCPLPPHLLHRFHKGDSNLLASLLELLLKLFRKMVPPEVPFRLNLLSVSFSNLKEPPGSTRGSIGFYLKEISTPHQEAAGGHQEASQLQAPSRSEATKRKRLVEEEEASCPTSRSSSSPEPSRIQLPPDVDPQTFSELPREVQEELVAQWRSREATSKPLEKPKATRRRRRNPPRAPEQLNTLWRYMEPRWEGTPGPPGDSEEVAEDLGTF